MSTINKNTIPEGFSISLALVDFIPVLFFAGIGIVLGKMVASPFVVICSVLALLSGAVKVLWKIIAAVKRRNIWWMFVQMRILMPLGFLGILIGCIISAVNKTVTVSLSDFTGMPQLLFFILGFLGIAAMVYCATKLDSADPKANWIEQIINSFAQMFLFLGMLVAYL